MAYVPSTSSFVVGPSPLRTSFCAQRVAAPRVRPARAHVVRMIAAEPVAATELSQKATELLSYLRAHKSIFHPGVGFTATHCSLFRKNDTGRSFTPLDELATNAHMLPGGSVAALMKMQEHEIVDKAKAAILQVAPSFESNETVANIIWHDMWYILRVVSYGVAVTATDFLHPNNMGMLKMLYAELDLPQDVIKTGLTAMKDAVLAQVTDPSLIDSTGACFDVVIDFLTA